jgi:hypothetical protein
MRLSSLAEQSTAFVRVQACDRFGRSVTPGASAAATHFATTCWESPAHFVNESTSISRVPFTFEGQARENLTVFSPGPMYHPEATPDASPARARSAHHSMGCRLKTAAPLSVSAPLTPGPGCLMPRVTARGTKLPLSDVRSACLADVYTAL